MRLDELTASSSVLQLLAASPSTPDETSQQQQQQQPEPATNASHLFALFSSLAAAPSPLIGINQTFSLPKLVRSARFNPGTSTVGHGATQEQQQQQQCSNRARAKAPPREVKVNAVCAGGQRWIKILSGLTVSRLGFELGEDGACAVVWPRGTLPVMLWSMRSKLISNCPSQTRSTATPPTPQSHPARPPPRARPRSRLSSNRPTLTARTPRQPCTRLRTRSSRLQTSSRHSSRSRRSASSSCRGLHARRWRGCQPSIVGGSKRCLTRFGHSLASKCRLRPRQTRRRLDHQRRPPSSRRLRKHTGRRLISSLTSRF